MKKPILFLLWVVCTLPLFGQSTTRTYKDINWIHGVGSKYFWSSRENYPRKFSVDNDPNYLALGRVIRVDGTNSIGIEKFAQETEKQATYSSNNFAIAHSMGGMVARRIDVDNARKGNPTTKFRGIVTVGTPLQGAAGARSLADGSFDDFIYNFTFKLTDPFASPLAAAVGGGLVAAVLIYAPKVAIGVGALTSAVLLSGAGTTIVYYVVKDQVKSAFGQQFSGQTLTDLIPGNDKYQTGQYCFTTYKWVPASSYSPWTRYFFPYRIVQVTQCDPTYANYADYATSTPKVHFVGQEDQPIFMKIAESTGDKGAESVRALNTVRDVAYGLRWFGFLDPVFAMKCGALGDYLGDGVNVDYAHLIDAVHMEHRHRLEEIPQRLWNCFYQRQRTWSRSCGWFSWFCGWIEDFINVLTCTFRTIFVEIWVGYYVPVIDPSDGVVSAASQRGEPGNTFNSIITSALGGGGNNNRDSKWKGIVVDVFHTNHNEMNGTDDMTKALEDLFHGENTKMDPIFRTKK